MTQTYGVLEQAKPSSCKQFNCEEMIMKHLPLVRSVSKRLAMRLPSHIRMEDLMSAGMIGLMQATVNFDRNKNANFQTYAEHRIRGAMLDELRALDWVPRSVRQKASQVKKIILCLEREKGKPAEIEEVTEKLGLSLDEYFNLLNVLNGRYMIDIEIFEQNSLRSARQELLGSLPREEENDSFRILSRNELKNALARAIDGLSSREKTILSYYYYEGFTLKEIAEILNLTESRICQIHTASIAKLRLKLTRIMKIAS